MHEVAIGLLGVGVDVVPDGAAHARALQGAENACEGDEVGGVGDGGELVGDGSHAELLRAVGIHEAREQVADLLRIAARWRVRVGGLFDDGLDVDLGTVVQGAECAVDGAVGRDGVLLEPFAVDVHEQVVLRACVLVLVAEIDARVHY